MGGSHSYQCRHQRWAWDTMVAATATKETVCKHRSLSTPPLTGAYAAHLWQGPVIQGQLPQENTWRDSGCCNITLASVTASLPHLRYPSLSPDWVSQSPLMGTDALRWPTGRGAAKSKAEPQKMCEQRREREISPSSLRSSRINLYNQLEISCICGILESTTNHPKIEVVVFGNNCRLGVCFLHLICFCFFV